MNRLTRLIHILRAALLLVLTAAMLAHAAQPDQKSIDDRLASPKATLAFKQYDAAHAGWIQRNLGEIYRADPAFKADADPANGRRPLADAIIGPITRKWLGRFCADFGIAASEPDFEQEVLLSLERIAGLVRAHPDWLKIMFSDDFNAWLQRQATSQRVLNQKIRRSGTNIQMRALIKLYQGEPRQAPPVAEDKAADVNLSYSYDPKRTAVIKNLDTIIERLSPMAALPRTDRVEFLKTVKAKLEGILIDDDTVTLIERYSMLDSYRLTYDVLLEMEGAGLSAVALEDLIPMVDIVYDDVTSFEEALALRAGQSQKPEGVLRSKRQLIEKSMIKRYQIPKTLGADFASDGSLAKPVAAVFAGMSMVDYPTKELFERALEFRVKRVLNMCPAERDKGQGAMDPEQFMELQAALPAKKDLFDKIGSLRKAGSCQPAQLLESDILAHRAYQFLSVELDRKMDLQTSNTFTRAAHEGLRKKSWEVSGCDCARAEGNGTIYGFYPLWTVSADRQLDFSLLSRIGLYGMTFDDNGDLKRPPGMLEADTPLKLIEAAHKHTTKVDWVISRSDWDGWRKKTPAEKASTFNNLVEKIVKHLAVPLHDIDWKGTAQASLSFDQAPTRGDGVTLNFKQFPVADKELFKAFVISLAGRLKAMKAPRQLNLMVTHHDIGKQAELFGYDKLYELIAATNKVDKDLPFADSRQARLADLRVLVLLAEPTQESKKQLRGEIQNILRGAESQRLLRDIIPVVEYDGASAQQLSNDIIYFADNFGGVGFWTLPFDVPGETSETPLADARSANRLLASNYQLVDEQPAFRRTLAGFVCPNRLWLRWLTWFIVIAALVASGFYFFCRSCNENVENSRLYSNAVWWLITLAVIAPLLLVLGDPLLNPIFVPLMVAIVGGGVTIGGLVRRHQFYKKRKKIP
jgi:hypothetical protein